MKATIIDAYNVHTYYSGVVKCLEDGFGPIPISSKDAVGILLSKIQDGHKIAIVVVDGDVVATATGFIERKLIHAGDERYKAENGASRVLHVEDVATRSDQRGNGYGVEAMKTLHDIAVEEKCYKIILDASVENLENFYSKLGYEKTELCLRKNIQ
jgi:histone acetyltransferase (RNA polymerase elongator complex component)